MTVESGELTRRYRVVDQMLTAHSILRDRYAFRADVLDVFVLSASALLLATTFLDPGVLDWLHVSQQAARVIIGITSIGIFIASIIQVRVDWKVRSSAHQKATQKLAELKSLYRELRSSFEIAKAQVVLARADEALSELIPIPDGEFIALKAQHRHKVEVSRLLDRFPNAPILVLRAKLSWRHTLGVLRSTIKPPDKDE